MSYRRNMVLSAIFVLLVAAAIFLTGAFHSVFAIGRLAFVQQTTSGAVSGVVFFDSDGDGLLDVDETGVADVTLEIMDAATGGLLYSSSAVSGLDGSYRFDGLPPETYTVIQYDAVGYASTTPNSLDVAVQDVEVAGVHFGDVIPIVVKGTVFNDLNSDGFQTLNEPGLAGSTIQVYDDANQDGEVSVGESLLGSSVSDASGNYAIYNILPGHRVARIIPFGGSTPGSDETPLTLISSEVGGNTRILDYGLIVASEPPPLECAASSMVDHKFNNKPIAGSHTIWFSAVMKVTGLPPGVTTINLDRSTIVFRANNIDYSLSLPKAKITYSPSAAASTTTYDAATQTWMTIVSSGNYDKDVFVSGLGFVVPGGGLPGKVKPLTWQGRYTANAPGLDIEWTWGAAIYSSFNANYSGLGVKPVDGSVQNPYLNSDPAGSPENYKAFLVDGATGNGGAEYVGKQSNKGYAAPCGQPDEGPYWVRVNSGGVSHTDLSGAVWSADKSYSASSWGYTGGTARSYSTAVSGTFDDLLYQRLRESPGEYRFSLPNGSYSVILRFAEFQANASTDRVMKITLEGVIVESALSIYGQAGRFTALDKTYSVTVNDGVLNIAFAKSTVVSSSLWPIVSAIEVRGSNIVLTPTPTPTQTPTRAPTPTPTATPTPVPYNQGVNAGGTTYTDSGGQVWSADKSFSVGSWGYVAGGAKSSSNPVAGTVDDFLYQKYRENMDEYRFTLPKGVYQVELRFAEFVVNNANDRKMKITIEGVEVESDLSIYGVVGKNSALTRSYTTSVSDGVLNIVFDRSSKEGKEPIVSAIRVNN